LRLTYVKPETFKEKSQVNTMSLQKDLKYEIPYEKYLDYLQEPVTANFGSKKVRRYKILWMGFFLSVMLIGFSMMVIDGFRASNNDLIEGLTSNSDNIFPPEIVLALAVGGAFGWLYNRSKIDQARLDAFRLKTLINDRDTLVFNFGFSKEEKEKYVKGSDNVKLRLVRRYSEGRFQVTEQMFKTIALDKINPEFHPSLIYRTAKKPRSSMNRVYGSMLKRKKLALAIRLENKFISKNWELKLVGAKEFIEGEDTKKLYNDDTENDIKQNEEYLQNLWESQLYFEYTEIVKQNNFWYQLFGLSLKTEPKKLM